eukprot:1382790-Amorphochlora_amoeboformis.AAC.1
MLHKLIRMMDFKHEYSGSARPHFFTCRTIDRSAPPVIPDSRRASTTPTAICLSWPIVTKNPIALSSGDSCPQLVREKGRIPGWEARRRLPRRQSAIVTEDDQ